MRYGAENPLAVVQRLSAECGGGLEVFKSSMALYVVTEMFRGVGLGLVSDGDKASLSELVKR